MVEKRSTGWAGRRGEDSAKSSLSTPRRKPDLPSRSLYKPVLSIASVYGTIVLLVWNMWTGKSHADISTPNSGLGLEPSYTQSQMSEGQVRQVPELQSAAQVAMARSAVQSKALIAEIMPRMSQNKAKATDSYDRAGSTFDLAGDHLHVGWGWTYQSASGLVGDQRQQEATSGLVPRIFEERGSSLGWQSLFELSLTSGEKVVAKDCSLERRRPLSSSQEEGFLVLGGEAIELECPFQLRVHWTAALLRLAAGAEVLRIRFWYESKERGENTQLTTPLTTVMSLTLWDFDSSLMAVCGKQQAQQQANLQALDRFDCFGVSGEVDGSPLIHIGRGVWIALEHPRAAWPSL
ncbi:unnamed protein product [Symbiodinium natans]|uniref:Uncharacterized protein n=1 Tax=Symbiodinium natans TaxID=878477 RepID=A0A812RFW1_9DINO|nr:unnamed protein product [Symbiodinium natans]